MRSPLTPLLNGSADTLSLLPTVRTLRAWQAAHPGLTFAYIEPPAGQLRVRVYASRAAA